MAATQEIVAVARAVRFRICGNVSFSCDGEGLTIGGIDLRPVGLVLSRDQDDDVACEMVWIEHRVNGEFTDAHKVGLALSELSGLAGIHQLEDVTLEGEE